MSWTPISSLVSALRSASQPPPGEIRTRAGALAVETFGTAAAEQPATVNLAALSLLLPRLEVHEMTPI